MNDPKPYPCPVCKGRQVISNDFYAGRKKTAAELNRERIIKSNIGLESIGFTAWVIDVPELTEEEQEEARILHSEVECRTCDGRGMVIV